MKFLSLVLVYLILLFNLCSGHNIQAASNKGRIELEKSGEVFWEVKTKEKMVALTFDDGPHPLYTPQILDTLAKYRAKATFFVIGAHAAEYPYIIKRQVDEGHEIANHTYNHNYRLYKNANYLKNELKKTSNTIQSIAGYQPSLFRPVGGYYNDLIINTAVKNDYRVIMWSWNHDTKDWRKPGVNKIINNVISDTRPGDIILLHDAGGDRSQTVKALDKILAALQKKGYECVTVSEMLYRSKAILPNPTQILPFF
ncbi:polysaccharide deacetylase family protein [Heyndrickxia sp. NPDC080065]|uniref:polysaccharide deacetylase family protein n=1 Tax=Heyndrickxia sp. NPDC080065 TaxID=3390568 RepID=UPI003D0752E8